MLRKVIVGISGGVDSAVTAWFLKERGHDVLAVFMKNWNEADETGHCSEKRDLLDAKLICSKIGINLIEVNFVKEYWNSVFCKFLEDYQNGLTPNPDILCNRHIKFETFFKYATEKLQFDAIATGHYARTTFGNFLENYKHNEDVLLLRAKDTFKDQTFFLSGVKQEALRKTMFPLGDSLKSDVKEIARKIGLGHIANKKESTGICFIGNRTLKDFIKEYVPSNPGHFIDINSKKIIGSHEGIHQWTIGQRCRIHSYKKPYFVVQKDVKTNNMLVASGTNHPALFSNVVQTSEPNWLRTKQFKSDNNIRCMFRFQHTKPLVNCTICSNNNVGLNITLDQPLRAITPGQYAVIYNGEECLGSARIISTSLIKSLTV